MECSIGENLKDCPCTYPDCPRKGKCCECVLHHRNLKELPACFFSEKTEKTYDRSIDKFIQDNS